MQKAPKLFAWRQEPPSSNYFVQEISKMSGIKKDHGA